MRREAMRCLKRRVCEWCLGRPLLTKGVLLSWLLNTEGLRRSVIEGRLPRIDKSEPRGFQPDLEPRPRQTLNTTILEACIKMHLPA
jgi:hypothetical protein